MTHIIRTPAYGSLATVFGYSPLMADKLPRNGVVVGGCATIGAPALSGMTIVGVLGAIFALGLGTFAASAAAPVAAAPTAAPALAMPDANTGPNSTSASFGDWVLNCQRLGEGTDVHQVCEVVQQMRAQDQQNPVAALAIGHVNKGDPLLLTVVLPVNVTFPSAPSFSTDSKDSTPVDLGWRKCLPGGCFADVALAADVLTRWKTGKDTGRLSWKDASGRDFAVNVSSNGLSQAIDALNKQPQSTNGWRAAPEKSGAPFPLSDRFARLPTSAPCVRQMSPTVSRRYDMALKYLLTDSANAAFPPPFTLRFVQAP